MRKYTTREQTVLATKIYWPMHQCPGGSLSRKAVLEQVDESLTRLGTDYVDLMQIHRDSDQAIIDAVERIATDRGVTMATVAMAWVLKNPVVNAPLIDSTKEKHLTDAAAAIELTLTDDEDAALEGPYTPREPTFF